MELVLSKIKVSPIVKFLSKHAVITFSVAAAYWTISALTPAMSKTFGTLGFDATIRLANILRGLVVVSPSAALGTGVGAGAFNATQGQPDLILPIVMAVLGLAFYGLSRIGKKSVIRNIALLAVYGAIGGFLVTVKKLSILALFTPVVASKFSNYIFGYKMFTTMAIYIAGYLIYEGVVFTYKKIKE